MIDETEAEGASSRRRAPYGPAAMLGLMRPDLISVREGEEVRLEGKVLSQRGGLHSDYVVA